MGSPITGLTPHPVPQQSVGGVGGVGGQQGQPAGRSFESVLRNGEGVPGGDPTPAAPPPPPAPSGARLEELRLDLMQRVGQIPGGNPSFDAMWPELSDGRSRMGLLREAMRGVGNTPTGTDLRGRFGQVEREWFELEQILVSDRELSTGELLGLQARLYQVSQHIEVMSKVVDQMTGGIRTILNTNV